MVVQLLKEQIFLLPCFLQNPSHIRVGAAAFLRAHFPSATAVLAAPASGNDGTGALVERADSISTMFAANPPSFSKVTAAFGRARHWLAVVLRALPSHRDADKLAKDLRGVAVSIGAGQLHRVLNRPFFTAGVGGATFAQTLA